MTDSRSELSALAERLSGHLGPFRFLTAQERDLVVSALRLAASQPDREMLRRILIANCLCDGNGERMSMAPVKDVIDAILLLLVGGDQKETQTTKPTPSSTSATATETATEAERDRCAAIVQMARFGEIDQDFRAIISIIEGGMTIEQIKEFCA